MRMTLRLTIIALLLALAAGACEASVLQGGDENASAVVFGATRTPNLLDENGTTEYLKLDVGLMGADNATYQLMDADNNFLLPSFYRPLSSSIDSGRQLVFFLIAKDSLFKLVNITPTGRQSIYLNWWATPKGSSDKAILRYYGITDWLINDNDQGIVVQVRVQNNGTENITVSPLNFTLFDQWGWPYYPTAGFDDEIVAPGGAQNERVLVGFTGISLLSRPAALAYDYMTEDQIIIDFNKDYVPLSDELVYGTAAGNAAASSAENAGSQNVSAAASNAATTTESAPSTPSGAASEPSTTPASDNAATGTNESLGSSLSIKDKLAESQARLNLTKDNLDKQTSEEGSSTSSVDDI